MKEYILVPQEDFEALKEAAAVLWEAFEWNEITAPEYVDALHKAMTISETKYRKAVNFEEKD